eukprot:scaffold237_cov146-Skeletonema_menzelii.AAC.5
MKLSSIFLIGLGLIVAVASGDSNLRANASSRQLDEGSGDKASYDDEGNAEGGSDDEGNAEGGFDDENSVENLYDDIVQANGTEGDDLSYDDSDMNQVSNSTGDGGGSWMYYLMLNALHGPLDAAGHGGCCDEHVHPRCLAPHIGPHKNDKTGSCSSSSSASGRCMIWNKCFWSGITGSSSATSNGSASGSGGDNGGGSGTQEQYLANGRGGNVQGINGSKGLNVWGFLVAALVAGVVSAALMAFKKEREEQTEPRNHMLSGAVQKRMALFRGGMFGTERPATASSPLCENDYENEPSLL